MREKKINWDKEVKEKPEKEQLKELEEHIKGWKKGYSKDGFVETWRKKYKHKGITFELAILRYFDHTNKFKPINDHRRICDRHVVVEFPKETKELADKLDDINCEFLYHDTLHSWNDEQNLNEQLQCGYEMAISDIEELPEKIQEKILELKEEIKELEKVVQNLEKI